MPQRGLFLVTGLPATGKSLLARALALAMGVPLLGKDAVKEPLLDVLGAADAGHSRLLSNASFAVLFGLADVQLALVPALVLEGNFRPGEHEVAIAALLERHTPLSCVQLLCRVPEPLRQERLRARGADATRHPGHRDAAWVATADLRSDAFLEVPGQRYVHDGSSPHGPAGCELIHSLTNRHLV